jgi:hypothetical protein
MRAIAITFNSRALTGIRALCLLLPDAIAIDGEGAQKWAQGTSKRIALLVMIVSIPLAGGLVQGGGGLSQRTLTRLPRLSHTDFRFFQIFDFSAAIFSPKARQAWNATRRPKADVRACFFRVEFLHISDREVCDQFLFRSIWCRAGPKGTACNYERSPLPTNRHCYRFDS